MIRKDSCLVIKGVLLMDSYLSVVYTLHIIAVAPILIYGGVLLQQDPSAEDMKPYVSKIHKLARIIFTLGMTALLYHGLALSISIYTGSWIWSWDILLELVGLR